MNTIKPATELQLHDPKALKVAASFASTEACTRPALAGVCVEKSGRMLASDGHKAVIIERLAPRSAEEYPTGHGLTALESDTIIPADAIRAATGSAIKRHKSLPILDQVLLGKNGKPTLYRTNLDQSQAIPFQPIDMQFPNMDAVLPKDAPAFTVALNADLAAGVFKALADLTKGGDGSHYVTVEFRTDAKALILKAETQDHKATAILMPLRRKDGGS